MNRDRDAGASTGGEDKFERLLHHAKPRPRPPEADEKYVRDSLYSEWDTVMGRRTFVRKASRWAIAASVLIAVGLLSQLAPLDSFFRPAEVVAEIQRIDGEVVVRSFDERGVSTPITTGAQLTEDDVLMTQLGQISLRLRGGGSLRIAENSTVRLSSSNEVELIRGALYFDSHGSSEITDHISIHTEIGILRNLGTQFVAQITPGNLTVSVREGQVAVTRGIEETTAFSGERIRVSEGRPAILREPISIYGDEWAWVDRMAPVYEIEGNSLYECLVWVARETGRRLEFSSPSAEQIARETILHGSIDMEPLPMLSAVLATTDLEYVVAEGALVVQIR